MDGVPPYDLIRDAVVDLGLGLVRIQHRRRTLEDLFSIEYFGGWEAATPAYFGEQGLYTLTVGKVQRLTP